MAKINKIKVENNEYEIEDMSALKEVPSEYKTKAENDELYQAKGEYLTEETDPTVPSYVKNISENDIANWNNKSEFSGDYDDLTNKPDLSQFITNTVNNLTNYYLKSETYTKDEVTALIGAIQQFHYEIVQELPQTGTNNILYLVPKAESQTQNVYDEYVYANNTWEKIGDTEIDLSNYVTTTDLNTALASYTTTADLTTLLAGKQNTIDSTHKLSSDLVDDTNATNKFVTSSEKTTWNGKQDLLTAGDNITIDSNNVISASATTHFYINHDSTSYQLSAENLAILQQAYEKYLNNKYFTMTLRSKYQHFSQSSDYKMEFVTVLMESNTAYFYFIIPPYANNYKNYSGFYYIIAPVSDGSLTKGELRSGAFNTPLIPNYAYQMNNGPYALVLNNTLAYTPTAGSYNPATAKYAEDQAEAVRVQYSTMPTAGADNLGKIVQYTGADTQDYTQGHFYIVVSDGESTPTYSWQEISFGGNDDIYLTYTYVRQWGTNLTARDTDTLSFINKVYDGINAGKNVYVFLGRKTTGSGLPEYQLIKAVPLYIGSTLNNIQLKGGVYQCDVANNYNKYSKYSVSVYRNYLEEYASITDFTILSDYSTMADYSGGSRVTYALPTNNTRAYTPTGDYNPATKKYVDDSIASAVKKEVYYWDASDTTSQTVLDMWTEIYNAYANETDVPMIIAKYENKMYVFTYLPTSGTTYDLRFYQFTCINGYSASYKGIETRSFSTVLTVADGSVTQISLSNQRVDYLINRDYYKQITNYDATKTQVLKNINGTLTWISEE